MKEPVNGIYTPNGDFIEFSDSATGQDLTTEFATWTRAGANVADFLGWLPDPDPILRKRGDSANILEALTGDDQVCMAMQNRRLRVLNKQQYGYRPGQDLGKEASAASQALYADLTTDLEAINLRNVISAVLDAPFFGFTVLELLWEHRGGKIRLKDIIAKPREWFAFNQDNKLVFRGENYAQATPLPRGKFILTQHFPTFENPYGLRLLSRCLWPVAFKRGGLEFYTRFLEKFGMPWVLAKAPQNAERDKRQAMANDLASMVQDAVAVLPYGSDAQLAQSKSTGTLHEKYIARQDKAISKVLTGQTLTAEMDGQGSRAASETHYTVAGDISDADEFLVVSTMNDIALTYRDINGIPGTLAPVFSYEEPEDYAARADLDKKLHSVGVRFKSTHFERRYGLNPDEFVMADSEADAQDIPGDSDHGISFAESNAAFDAQDRIDQAIADILPEALKANKKFAAQIEKAVMSAESFEDMQILLAELLAHDVDNADLEDLLSHISANAAAFGHAAVQEETDG